MSSDVCAVICEYLLEEEIPEPIHIGADDNSKSELIIITEVGGAPSIRCYGICRHTVRRPQVEIRVRSATGERAYEVMHQILLLCDNLTILGGVRMQMQWMQDAGSRTVNARDGASVECREVVAQFLCFFPVDYEKLSN